MTDDEKSTDPDSLHRVCVVCRDPRKVIVADCDAYFLPRSGKTIRDTLKEWRQSHRSMKLSRDLPQPGQPNSAPLCNSCLEVISDVDRQGAGLENRLASLFGSEEDENPWSLPEESTADKNKPGKPSSTFQAPEPVRQSARSSVRAKSASIKAILQQRAKKRAATDQPNTSEIKVRRSTDGKIFTVVVEQENDSRSDSGCENDSETITLNIETDDEDDDNDEDEGEEEEEEGQEECRQDGEKERRPKYRPKAARAAKILAAAESPYIAYSLGNLGLEYVERRVGLRGSEAWFNIRQCRLCDATFDGRVTELLRHLESSHSVGHAKLAPQEHPFVCHLCLAGFDSLWEYVAHVMFEELWMGENEWFKCRFCNVDCLNPRRLEAHFEETHSSDGLVGGPFVCEECVDDYGQMMSFTSLAEFTQHRQSATVGRHVICVGRGSRAELTCPNPVCEYRAEGAKDLCLHAKDARTVMDCVKPFRCPASGCDGKFESLVGLERHLAVVEFCPNRHCDTCGKRFPTPMDGEQHRNRVHLKQRPFICDVCGKSYECQNRLNQHKAVHTKPETNHGGKSKMCYLCGKVLSGGKRAVENHVDRFHKRKEISCEFCGMTFYYRNLLNKHMAKEHDYKKYRIEFPCPICSKIFTSSDSVLVHRFLVHKIRDPKLKIMSCPDCGKEFVKRTAFNNHLVSHTGLKPHPCPFCEHRSITFSNLADHTKKVHRKRIKRVYGQGEGADSVVETLVTTAPIVGDIEVKREPNSDGEPPLPDGAVGRGPGYVIMVVQDDSVDLPVGTGRRRTGANGKPKRIIQVGVPRGRKPTTGGSVSDSVLRIKDARGS